MAEQPRASAGCELVPADAPPRPTRSRRSRAADQIVFAPGSLYTSVLPVLCVPELRDCAVGRQRGPGGPGRQPAPAGARDRRARRHRPPGRGPGPRRAGSIASSTERDGGARGRPRPRPGARAWSRCAADVARADGLAHDPGTVGEGACGLCCSPGLEVARRRTNGGTCRDQRLRAHRPLVHPGAAAPGAARRRRAGRGQRPHRRQPHDGLPAQARLGGRHAAQRDQAAPTTASRSTAATIRKLEVMDPAEIPWGDHGVDVVIESTGLFTAREKAAGAPRRQRRARRSSPRPSGDADATICMGVNDAVVRRRRSTP